MNVLISIKTVFLLSGYIPSFSVWVSSQLANVFIFSDVVFFSQFCFHFDKIHVT